MNENIIDLKQTNITLTVPNKDSFTKDYTMIPKEVLQKMYQDKIGSYINYCGASKKVKDVQITDGFIYVDLI